MAMEEKMEIVTKEALLQPSPADYRALDPELGGCCPFCPGCGSCCPSCDSCPGCSSCPGCCCCPPCCPPCCGSCPGCDSCPGCGSCPGCCCCPTWCCPCCGSCPGCDSCPGCGSCPGCCEGCCPPSCDCCCQLCCFFPKLLCQLPKLIGCPVNFKKILIILGVVVLIVVIAVLALLFGFFIAQPHTETLVQMTVDGLEGEEVQLKFPMDKEEVATFYVDDGTSGPATIIYDFNKLLIGYKPEHKEACYLTRMDKGNVQGVDRLLKEFQAKLSTMHLPQNGKEKEQEEAFPTSQMDHSNLGTTISILCKHIPIFYT